MTKHIQSDWFKIFIIFQISIAMVICLGFWSFDGSIAGISALMGGIIGIVPGVASSILFFKEHDNLNAQSILSNFYLAEGLKFFLFLLLFTLALLWSKLRVLPLFAVFITSQMTYWLLPFMARSNKK